MKNLLQRAKNCLVDDQSLLLRYKLKAANIDSWVIESILEKVNLIEEKNKKVKNLSGGMLRRLGIAQALIGNPNIIIVDEPTAGLDPEERVRLRNIFMKLPKDKLIIISTHIVEDLELIANHIAILNKGKTLINNEIENIISLAEGKVHSITIPLNIELLSDIMLEKVLL